MRKAERFKKDLLRAWLGPCRTCGSRKARIALLSETVNEIACDACGAGKLRLSGPGVAVARSEVEAKYGPLQLV